LSESVLANPLARSPSVTMRVCAAPTGNQRDGR
jgi:hypothetical protein